MHYELLANHVLYLLIVPYVLFYKDIFILSRLQKRTSTYK